MCEKSGVFNSKSIPKYCTVPLQKRRTVPTYRTRTITKKTYRTSVPYFLAKIEAARTVSTYQRWSRGHKARGQGHKKNPRPRTAFPRTDPLEAKDRNARGQGQGPKTQAQAFSKKKIFKNFFRQSPIYSIGVSRIFDWGRPKPQITCNNVIKIFPKRKFLWDKDIVG